MDKYWRYMYANEVGCDADGVDEHWMETKREIFQETCRLFSYMDRLEELRANRKRMKKREKRSYQQDVNIINQMQKKLQKGMATLSEEDKQDLLCQIDYLEKVITNRQTRLLHLQEKQMDEDYEIVKKRYTHLNNIKALKMGWMVHQERQSVKDKRQEVIDIISLFENDQVTKDYELNGLRNASRSFITRRQSQNTFANNFAPSDCQTSASCNGGRRLTNIPEEHAFDATRPPSQMSEPGFIRHNTSLIGLQPQSSDSEEAA